MTDAVFPLKKKISSNGELFPAVPVLRSEDINETEDILMKKTLSVFLAALMLLSLCACGSSSQTGSAATESYYVYSNGTASMDAEYLDDSYGGFAVSSAKTEDSSAPEMDPEKIIYSASATVETTDFDTTIERLRELVQQYGGFVESSSLNGSNYYSQSRGYSSTRSASYTLRIPSARFEELMSSLSTLGNVPYSHTYTENITSQYFDVEARLTAYRTQEARLLEMMELAETVSDVIVIEDRLTELRYQIESLQSTLNNWDRRVSYSSIDLSVQEVAVYTPEANPSYGQELWLALTDGLRSTAEFLGDLLVAVVASLPALIVLAVVIFVTVRIVKKRRAAKKAKKAVASEPGESKD